MKSFFGGLAFAILCLTVSIYAQSQDVTTGMKLTWNQGKATETTLTLSQVNSFQYKAYIDGATTGNVISVTCVNSSNGHAPFVCSTPIQAGLSLGNHTVVISAAAPDNQGGFTADNKSTVCSFRFIGTPVPVPSAPYNLLFS